MKLLTLILTLAVFVTGASAQPKATAPATPTLTRAVIVFAPGGRPVMAHQQSAYHISVGGEKRYHASGDGPKTAGIYDVEVYPATSLIVVHEYHVGSTKYPKDATYRLKIDADMLTENVERNEYVMNVVDGRRLLVYSVVGDPRATSTFPVNHDKKRNLSYKAVAVDNTTGEETFYAFSIKDVPVENVWLGLGIYDFLITESKDKKDYVVNVYRNHLRGYETITVYAFIMESRCMQPGTGSVNICSE